MKNYVIANPSNFDVMSEHHTLDQAKKEKKSMYPDWDYIICTKKQLEKEQKQVLKAAQGNCGVCGRTFYSASDYLVDQICNSCKETELKKTTDFLLNYASGG